MPYIAPTQTDQYGTPMAFGFNAAYAPNISNFLARNVTTSDSEPEIFVTATNGEGLVEAIAISKPAHKMLKISISGYVTNSFDRSTLSNTFVFLSRRFFIKKISDPVPKGAFVEVTIDAESYALIPV